MTEKAVQEEYDVLFLDELVYTIGSKLFDEQLLLDFLDHKPEKLEVILTGQGPSEALIERADYVSELKKSSIRLTRGLRQEMESSGNAEKQEKRYCFAGKMIPCRTVSFSDFAGNEPKSVMEQVSGDCRDNLRSIWKPL